jgi:hypothetical protein
MSMIAAATAAAASPPPPWINLSALWRIIVVGLLAGAGLPAVFAIGLRALNYRSTGPASPDDDHVYGGSPVGLVGGGICFAIVLAAIGWGIYFIVHAS